MEPTLFLIKVTLLLGVALLVARLLGRANPRWRMRVCEAAILGVLFLPLLSLLPSPMALTFPEQFLPDSAPVAAEVESGQSQPMFAEADGGVLPSASEEAAVNANESGFTLSLSWPEALLAAYLLGIFFLILRQVWGGWRMNQVVAGLRAAPERVESLLNDLVKELSVAQRPTLRVTDEQVSPFVTGFRNKTIVLPATLLEEGHESTLRLALRHELHHLVNRDLLRASLIQLFVMVLWFHPFAWLLRRVHVLAMEELGDRVAAEEVGTTAYSATLAQLVLDLRTDRGMRPATLGLFHTPQILSRLRRLRQPAPYGPLSAARSWLAIVLLALAVPMLLSTWTLGHPKHRLKNPEQKKSLVMVLPEKEQKEADEMANKVLGYLIQQQEENGSYAMGGSHRVGFTGLVGMSFHAHGGLDPASPYHRPMIRCFNYIVTQQKENGMIGSSMYEHSIATWFMASLVDKIQGNQRGTRDMIQKAVAVMEKAQAIKKIDAAKGGWRYSPVSRDSDLSVSVWVLRALWAAKEAKVTVSNEVIAAGVKYVQRLQNADGGFAYVSGAGQSNVGRTGMGLYVLQRVGLSDTTEAKKAAAYLIKNGAEGKKTYPFYGQFWGASAMSLRGGDDAKAFAKTILPGLKKAQAEDGSFVSPAGPLMGAASVALTLGSVK